MDKMIDGYIEYLQDKLTEIKYKENENIEKASEVVAESINNGGVLYVFGSGHSHMISEEIYARAGGLAYVKAILPDEVMLHQMPNKSAFIERLEGYAGGLLDLYKLDDKDTLLVISNSGRNGVPVEMCLEAKKRGAKVIVITSLTASKASTSRHSSGKRIFEIADVVMDNHAPIGDAAFKVEGVETSVGPVSTFTGVAIVNSLIVGIVDRLNKLGHEIPIFKSSNVDGCDEYNNELFDKYYGYWK